MTATQLAHFRLMSQAAQQGRITTHYKAESPLRAEATRTRQVYVDGTEYDTVLDAATSLGVSEASIRRMIARGEGKYLD